MTITLVVLVILASYPVDWTCALEADYGSALFLTPFIEKGCVDKARNLCRVEGLGDGVESYSGYLTVDEKYDSNLFFWFFPVQNQAPDAPLLLWLNGGPGVSSLVGAMMENGPLAITESGQVIRRNASWTESFSMLYIDNPVGTGYSFTGHECGVAATTTGDVVPNLYRALTQFFKLFPHLSENDFYIGGQSYAGKYVPALGRYIHDMNHASPSPEIVMHLTGVYIGGGFCDPPHMLPEAADSLYHLGLLSDHDTRLCRSHLLSVVEKSLSAGRFDFKDAGCLFARDKTGDPDNVLGLEAFYSKLLTPMENFLNSHGTRRALHVGSGSRRPQDYREVVEFNSTVYRTLFVLDLMQDTNEENGLLMDKYKVLHFSGNMDTVVSVPMTEAFLSHVQWSGSEQYRQSGRDQWHVDGQLVGYFTQVGNFTRVVLGPAGHYVPYDQPELSLLMMKKFTFDEPFNEQK